MGQTESVPAAAEGAAVAPQLGEGGPAPSALVIVGPSGVGKGTLINRLMESDPRFGFSCSHTTRPPREGEVVSRLRRVSSMVEQARTAVWLARLAGGATTRRLPRAHPSATARSAPKQDGVHYHFTTHEAFEAGIAAGKFLEHAHVHKNIYGTSVQAVQDVADSGRCCVLDIDVQGARQVGAGPGTVWAAACALRRARQLAYWYQVPALGLPRAAPPLSSNPGQPCCRTLQVRKAGLKAIFVFIAPPSLEELEHRLRGRATGEPAGHVWHRGRGGYRPHQVHDGAQARRCSRPSAWPR